MNLVTRVLDALMPARLLHQARCAAVNELASTDRKLNNGKLSPEIETVVRRVNRTTEGLRHE